jgi:hypothetical protein
MKWWVLGIGTACLFFYLGGSYSFSYTHVCARSHHHTVFEATHDNVKSHVVTVCDAYTGNSKRWSPGDPVRAVVSEPFTRWYGVILVGIALVIGALLLIERLAGG